MSQLSSTFETKGYIVIKGLLDKNEVAYYKKELAALADQSPKKSWTWADGLTQNENFWPVIFHDRIRQHINEIFGPQAKFLQHNDLHVGFSSFTWHRDSVNRRFPKGPDFDESQAPYRLARVAMYLQEYEQSGFRFGMIPGSHRPDKFMEKADAKRLQQRTSTLAKASYAISGRDWLEKQADWIATEPGDCVIFDPRVVHTGSRFEGVKYSMFAAYGVPNIHFKRHRYYYCDLREDLGYKALAPALVEKLKAEGLYAEPEKVSEKIDAAWIPSNLFTFVAKQFK